MRPWPGDGEVAEGRAGSCEEPGGEEAALSPPSPRSRRRGSLFAVGGKTKQKQKKRRRTPRQVLSGRAERRVQVRIQVNPRSSTKNQRSFQRNEVDGMCLPFPKVPFTFFVHLPWVSLDFFIIIIPPLVVVSRVASTN